MKKKKKVVLLVTIITISIIITTFGSLNTVSAANDYGQALSYSIQFYDANKCGPDVGKDQVFNWRGACHTKDGADKNLDLTGGFHDAGDHVKFGLPQGYTAAVLGWALYEFGSSMGSSKNKLISELKYFTDYFKKCHTNENTFYYQIGDGDADHTYWGPPESQSTDRPTMYVADSSSPASDILGETAAALALMYINTGDTESLKVAKELYAMGTSNLGKGQGQSFYQASSYGDDLAWGACWLAEATGDSKYIEDAEKYIELKNSQSNNQYQHKWAVCWDDMYLAAFYKLYDLTGDTKYSDAIDYNLDYWMNDLTTSPGGMKFLNNWGALRYNAAASFLALLRYQQTADTNLLKFAQKQIDYILGDNPSNMSFIIGYGSKWPLHPHHRAANGGTYANSGNTAVAKHTLTGALVGGPDQSDKYLDDVNQYQYTEVALDYNAGLVGALAGLIKLSGGAVPTAKATKTSTSNQTTKGSEMAEPTPTKIASNTTNSDTSNVKFDYSQSDWGSGSTVNLTVTNTGSSSIDSWNLTFDFTGNQKISNLWNGSFTQSGSSVTITPTDWNKSLPANGSVSFGFNIDYSGKNDVPTNLSIK